MTFSIAGVCAKTGQLGFGVTTSSVCVGARVGLIGQDCVIFSQARTDPRLHTPGAAAYAETNDVGRALTAMKAAGTYLHWRQLGVFARNGDAVFWSGDSCLPHCGGLIAQDCLALGNSMGSDRVLAGMTDGFNATSASDAPLADRLLAGLVGGENAGGETTPLQSAVVKVLGEDDLCDVDIRIDKSTDPLGELRELLDDWKTKAAAYRLRSMKPDEALPSADIEL